MPEEAEGWYAHIAESIEMLREELRSMEAVGATPEEFGLKVRSHPDTLVVTARNKLGSGQRVVVYIGLGNSFIETAFLKRDDGSLQANRRAAQLLASELADSGHSTSNAQAVSGGWLVRGAPPGPVLSFIGRFQNHPGAMITDPGPVRRYIQDRQESELAAWDILFASTRGGEQTLVDNSLGMEINCQKRSAGRASDAGTLRITNKQRVASRGVEKTGLTPEEIAAAETRYRAEKGAQGLTLATGGINYPDWIYRAERKRPLLIVHLLKIDSETQGPERGDPVVAYSISFPRTAMEEKRVEYVVNTTWVRENFREDFEDDELSGDDDDDR